MPKKFWLMKCEASECTFAELKERPGGVGHWRGVRNYQARNFIRNEMAKGDLVLFYNSNCETPGVGGIAEIVRAAYPDPSAFDRTSSYYDAKSASDDPRWFSVDVKWKRPFKRFVSLADLKATPALADMRVVQRGQRLSIQPVTKAEFDTVSKLGGRA
jgi:predicted RNA-binding protein with PUA-like domain